jgi:uncharacterized protein involved in exopolysaccharide biosynthesis
MTTTRFGASRLTDVYDSVRRNIILVAAVFVVLLAVALAYVSLAPREYVAGANVLVVNGNTRDDPTLSSPDLPSIATSTVVLERVRKSLNLANVSLKELKAHLTAKTPAFRSSILRIQYADSDKARAALIANGVADELTRYYREISTARYDADLTALNGELAKQSDKIRKIDGRVGAAGVPADVAAASASSATVDSSDTDAVSAGSLERDRALSNAALQGDMARLDAVSVSTQARAQLARKDVLESDPLYQNLLSGASTDAATLAKEKAVYRSTYPGLPELEAKVDSLNAAAAAEEQRALSSPKAFSPTLAAAESEQRKAEAIVATDRARLAAFDDLIAQQQARASALAPLALLRLERAAAKENYMAISARLATALANRADALSLGSVVVVDRAITAETQIGLGRRTMFGMLALLIMALAVGSGLLADVFNPRLRRVAQIEALYGHPVVATIGRSK